MMRFHVDFRTQTKYAEKGKSGGTLRDTEMHKQEDKKLMKNQVILLSRNLDVGRKTHMRIITVLSIDCQATRKSNK